MKYSTRIIVIVAVVFAVYFNALSNDFIYDDLDQVAGNIWITSINYIPAIFLKNSWGYINMDSNYYRPMMHIIYMFGYYVFGLRAWGFHLINIILHAGVTILVYLLILDFLKKDAETESTRLNILSLFAALLFATHPIHTEAVTWISGIPDVSFTFFGLLSFYFYIISNKRINPCYIVSVASFLIALFCKETALIFLVIFLLYDFTFRRKAFFSTQNIKKYIPFFIMACIFFVFRINALKSFVPNKFSSLSPLQLVINIPPLFSGYLEKLLLPVNLNIYHSYHPVSSFSLQVLPTFIITLIYLSLWFLAYKKNKTIFFGMSILVLPLIPVFYLPAFRESLFAERYLYMPSFGLVLVTASIMARIPFDRSRNIVIAAFAGITILGFYSAGTIIRNMTLNNELSLWMDTVKKSPDAAQPHNNLGFCLLGKNGLEEEAIKHFLLAIKLKPNYDGAFDNLGCAYRKINRTDDAIKCFQKAISLAPDTAEYHNDLGETLMGSGNIYQAAIEFDTAARLSPTNQVFQNNLAIALGKLDQKK